MINDQERLTATTGWVHQRCQSFSSLRIENHRRSAVVRSRILTLCFVLIVAGSSGFARVPNSGEAEPATASIEGVINVSGQQEHSEPIPGVRVTLTPTSPSSQSLSATTDDAGRYQFAELASGVYMLEASLEGFQTVNKNIELERGQ